MLKEAIMSYGKYSDNQCKVICALVDLAVDGAVYTTVIKLHDKTGVARPTIYSILNVLLMDKIIAKDPEQKGVFIIQQKKIDFIVNLYKKATNTQ
jgi:CTP-dependent riboflavin kinase